MVGSMEERCFRRNKPGGGGAQQMFQLTWKQLSLAGPQEA